MGLSINQCAGRPHTRSACLCQEEHEDREPCMHEEDRGSSTNASMLSKDYSAQSALVTTYGTGNNR